jgi:streptogramin lyase
MRVVAEIDLDGSKSPPSRLDTVQIVFAFDGLWVLDGAALAFVEPGTNTITRRLEFPYEGLSSLTAGDGALWLSAGTAGVLRVTPSTGEYALFGEIPANGYNWGLAWADQRLWVATNGGNRLVALNGATGRIELSIPLTRPGAVVSGAGSLWVPLQSHDAVVRVDPSSGQVLGVIDIGGPPGIPTATDTAVWVAAISQQRLVRIDPREDGPTSAADIGATPTPATAVSN